MENNRKLINQSPETEVVEWFQTWSDFLTESPFFAGEKSENSTKIMQKLLEAITLGDSCINATPQEIESLNNLVVAEQEVSTQIAPFVYDGQYAYLYRYWSLENQLCRHVLRLKKQKISEISFAQYSELLTDTHQNKAIENVAKTGFTVITGGPGTGKTYTLARIIAMLNQEIPNIRIAMAAPTGKAAQRMKEALQKSFSDEKIKALLSEDLKRLTPITTHRLLGLGSRAEPRFHEKQPLPYDVIVVDEASMLDLNLAKMLFAAVPEHARLILLGDANQLASVDVGSVLADLQQVKALRENFVHLVTSRRFQEGALIGEMAKFIQQNHEKTSDLDLLKEFENKIVQETALKEIQFKENMPDQIQLEYLDSGLSSQFDFSPYYDKLMLGYANYIQSLKEYLSSEALDEEIENVIQSFDLYRILTSIRHGALGLTQLNIQMEQRLLAELKHIKQGEWYVGRPVMMTYNDYQLGLSNGDIGICFRRMDQGQNQFEVYFPSLEKWVLATRLPKSMETAFALTIHKSQGSEFAHTAVVLDESAKNLLSKELIYTAITRAKSVISLLVDRSSFVQSLRVNTSRKSGIMKKLNKL